MSQYKSMIFVALIATSAQASNESRGPEGINATGLTLPNNTVLTGAGISIGQVEVGRPPKTGVDSPANVNPSTNPAEVWVQTTMAGGDTQLSEHAALVADIMINSTTGVAPDASLYSGAFVTESSAGYIVALQTIQRIATRPNSAGPRVINNSWSKALDTFGSTDGNTLLTLGADWMASNYEVLLVFSANTSDENTPVPGDNYNGISIDASTKVGNTYRKLAGFDAVLEENDAGGERVSVDLLAPGDDVQANGQGGDLFNFDGRSAAVPHVTGTVALLQQYGDFQINNVGGVHWDSTNPQRHEVMKAVLLNSADKIFGVHGSLRTVVSNDATGNYDWEDSQAFADDTLSLDVQLGAGHLNAGRASTQFKTGEWDVGNIPAIGWDHHETGGIGTTLGYTLPEDVFGYIAVTLVWDRQVTKTGGSDTVYDPSNVFTGALNDLDLFVVPVGWDNLLEDAVATSASSEDNVEHIFADIPEGDYEIVVNHFGGVGTDQDYALAWWTGPGPITLSGDFDGDGDVDGDDLTDWKTSFGPGGGADADGDGDSDGADFLTWQRELSPASVVASGAVPEPAAWMLAALGLPLLLRRLA